MSKNILLFGARRRIYLAEKLRIVAELEGVKVFGCDTDEMDPLRFHVDQFFVVPPVTSRGFLQTFTDITTRAKIGSVLLWNDADITWFNSRRSHIDSLGVRLLLPPTEVVEMFCDKRATDLWAKTHGIRHPRAIALNDPSFPCIVKPRFGQGSVGVQLVRNKTELRALACRPDEIVAQEFIQGAEYTIDVALAGSTQPLFIAPRRRIKIRGGEVLIARLELLPAIIDFVKSVCCHFSFHALFNLQVFVTSDEIILLEFNPRLGGGSDLTSEAGANIARYLMQLHLSGAIQSSPPQLRDGLTMTRYLEADFF